MSTPSTRWIPLAIVLLGVVALGSPYLYHDHYFSANEAARLHAAMAIVDHGSLHIDAVWDDIYPGWRDGSRLPNVDVAVRDGHYYLDKAPGTSLLATPVLFAMRAVGMDVTYARTAWLLALLFAAIPSAIFVGCFRRWLERQFGAASPAVLVAPAVVLASPWLIYGSLFFGHALAAALLGLGLLFALGSLRSDDPGGRPGRDAFVGGLLIGLAVLAEYQCALIAVGVAVAMLADPARRARLPWLIVGGLGPAIALLAWNTIAFGGPLAFAYGFKADPRYAATHAVGFYGITLPNGEALHGILTSARRGLFFMAPWLAIGVAGAIWCLRGRGLSISWRVVLILGVFVAPLAIGGFPDWHGGMCLGPRYLLFALPVFGIAAAVAVDRLKGARWAPPVLGVLAGLAVSSGILALAGHLVRSHIGEQIANPLYEVVLPVLSRGGPGPTMWVAGTGITIGSVFTVLAFAAALGLSLVGVRVGRVGTVVTLMALAAIVHLTLAAMPRTEGREARAMVLEQRGFSHLLLGHTEAEREVRREFQEEVRRLRATR